MQLSERGLACYIAMQNGIEGGIPKEDLANYFDLSDKKLLRFLGKTKNGLFYPNNKVWFHAICQIIHQNKSLYDEMVKNEDISLCDCMGSKVGKITFKTYLTQRQLEKFTEKDIFKVNKISPTIAEFSYLPMSDTIIDIQDSYNDLSDFVDTICLSFDDKICYLKIKNKDEAHYLITNGFIEKDKRNLYKLTDKTLIKTFLNRLDTATSSVKGTNIDKLYKKTGTIIVNTLLSKDLHPFLNQQITAKGYKLIGIEEKADINDIKYYQFFLMKN